MIVLKSQQEIEIMRAAGARVAEVVERISESIVPGVSTEDLDHLAHTLILKQGGSPTFLGYLDYPKTICTSINEEVVHGIPNSKRILKEGDIISVDCGITYKGYVADHARTFFVGKCDPEKLKLIQETEKALFTGIQKSIVGNRVGDIGAAVESVAHQAGYGVVRDFVGHGIGRRMHEEPQVPNYGVSGSGPRLKAGLVIAIEPMFNLGTERVRVLKDGWTVVTEDRKCSAHFEHTIAILPDGPQILTLL